MATTTLQELADIIFEGKSFEDTRHLNQLYAAFQWNLQKTPECSEDSADLKEQEQDHISRIREIKKFFQWCPIPDEYHKRFKKSAPLSTLFRERGNKYIHLDHETSLLKSLRAYNLAIVFALPNSLELALAMEKRADILLRINEPDLAQMDIHNVAANTSYPSKSANKLIHLQNKCGVMKSKKLEISRGVSGLRKSADIFYKVRNKNKNVDGLSEGAKIDYLRQCGRRVIVERDFDVGEVILVDEPYCLALEKGLDWDLEHCSGCSKVLLAGFPCDCCSFAMYCSTTCKLTSARGAHKYEKYLSYLKATKLMSLKVILAARILFKVGPEELYRVFKSGDELYECCDKEGDPKRGFNANGIYSSKDYLPIYHLISHTQLDMKAKSNCFKALVMVELMDECGGFFRTTSNEDTFKTYIAALLLRHIESISYNAITLSQMKNEQVYRYGAAVYPVLCLVNHSCDPNCVPVRSLRLLRTSVIAIKPLKMGDEVTFSYAPHFLNSDVMERREFLMNRYNFKCICEACNFGWSPNSLTRSIQESQCNSCGRYILEGQCPKCRVKDIEIRKDVPVFYSQVAIIEKLIRDADFIQALELIKPCLTFCYNNFPGNFYLCLEFQELFKTILVGLVSY